jgi:DNA-directed RNA polymerase subunit M/transcription elongation factor TFIIS
MANSNNYHEIRVKTKELLCKELQLSDLESADLEIGIFNSSIDYANSMKISLSWSCQLFIDTYINNARSIFSNLKKDSYIKNTNLIDKLKNKDFPPHKLAYMNCYEIFPEKWKNIIEKQKLKFKAAYEIKQVAMIDTIKCGKCKKNKISYYELQTRSGDEAMTCYFNCLVCGHKWKN